MKTNGVYITKGRALLFLILFYIAGWGCYQAMWLISKHANATILAFEPLNHLKHHQMETVTVRYYADGKEYTNIYLRNGLADTMHTLSITYLLFDPSVSRPDTLLGNWALVLFTSVLFFAVIAIIFIREDIIPSGSGFLLSWKFPFIRLFKKT